MQKVKYYVKILDVIVYYRLRGGAKSDMPNIKSAKKRVKVIEKKTLRNIEEAKTLFSQATRKIDQACTKGVIVKNTAARKKSNLSKKLNAAIA